MKSGLGASLSFENQSRAKEKNVSETETETIVDPTTEAGFLPPSLVTIGGLWVLGANGNTDLPESPKIWSFVDPENLTRI